MKWFEVSDWSKRLVEALWTTPKQVEEAWDIAEAFRKELLIEGEHRRSVPQADGADGETLESKDSSGHFARELSDTYGGI